MPAIISAIGALGSGLYWLIKELVPWLVKKLGASTVKLGIQKAISITVVVTAIAFYSALIVFISETYQKFQEVLQLIDNPSSAISGGEASSAFSCFLNLLHASGIANGFNSAFNFLIVVLIFMFSQFLYKITTSTLKIISDEVSKSLKLV